MRTLWAAALLAMGCGGAGNAGVEADAMNTAAADSRPGDSAGPERDARDQGNTDKATADAAGEHAGDATIDATADVAADAPGDRWSGEVVDGAGESTGSGCLPAVEPAPGVVVTTRGAVAGEALAGSYAFRGIPYAAQPVGELRWRPPEQHACWEGVRAATAFGAICPQLGEADNVVGSEDCLTLNVWTPKDYAGKSAAVMFFIHGGGNRAGSSAEKNKAGKALYDGRWLAESFGVVVVTINYRLGALGFLALDELSAESLTGVSGNYGILDQLLALEWVQENIAAFGGDPSRVMIFGESAGAVDVCVLLASPLASGLFSTAAMQSGACYQDPLPEVAEDCRQFLDQTACKEAADVAGCLRGLSVAEVTTALPGSGILESLAIGDAVGFRWGPAVDGWMLPASPINVLEQGEHNAAPFIVGSTTHETGAAMPKVQSPEEYEEIVGAMFGAFGDAAVQQVLALYPADAYATPRLALVALTTDMRFTCTARAVARAAAAGQDEPVFRYVFGRIPEYAGAQNFGAFHGLELAYLFHVLETPNYTPKPADLEVSAAMEGYWTRLAATGDPNGEGAVLWPEYDPDADPYLLIDSPASSGAGYHAVECDFWDLFLP